MNKKKEPAKPAAVNKPKKNRSVILLTILAVQFLFLAAIIGAGIYFYAYPQKLSEQLNVLFSKYVPSSQLHVTDRLNRSIEQLETKVSDVARQNAYFLDIKADSSVILGMVERLDKLEKKTDKISLLSNDGALILSSAMMIKEAISHGNNFIYEAEVLKQLSENQTDIAAEVDYLSQNSSRQFISDNLIVERFNAAYHSVVERSKPQPETGWKKRLLSKIREYITISKNDESAQTPTYDKIKELDAVKNLVVNDDLVSAVNLLSEEKNAALLEEAEINEWLELVKNKLKIYQSLSKIASYSLALMKADNLKNAGENPNITSHIP